jgi:two-component system sensor histidine kinase ChvG
MTVLTKLKRFMASVTATAKPEFPQGSENQSHTWWLWRRSGQASNARHLSPIVLRILAVNVMALVILVGGLLYLGRYQDRIIARELDDLLYQSRIIASAVAEGAIVIGDDDRSILSPLLARLMVRRLAETTETRTRLFDMSDAMLVDSRALLAAKPKPQDDTEVVTAKNDHPTWLIRIVTVLFDGIDLIHERREYPLYNEENVQKGSQYESVRKAMHGDMATQVWRSPKGGLTLAAAVPVQHYKNVLGAVMMSRSDANIDKEIATVRIDILEIFCFTLLVTILFSLYLARAIARPIRLLALAAEGLRHGQMQIVGMAGMASLLNRDAIPDMTNRKDEIGDLSGALRDLTSALAQRIGAIENFAADVAHEIKNPLTSLRSAVETAERIQDPVAQKKLMFVIRDDVDRLDRLITDIATASRLDAELSRDQAVPVDVRRILEALVDFYHQPGHEAATRSQVLMTPVQDVLIIQGVEIRLVQVLQNLIENALSFSPPDQPVYLTAGKHGRFAVIVVSDSGPGIPDNKVEAIFDRFYSERPKAEKFGTHSGLGLSISRQIVEAHRGKIWAENIKNAAGANVGARFIVRLPLVIE